MTRALLAFALVVVFAPATGATDPLCYSRCMAANNDANQASEALMLTRWDSCDSMFNDGTVAIFTCYDSAYYQYTVSVDAANAAYQRCIDRCHGPHYSRGLD